MDIKGGGRAAPVGHLQLLDHLDPLPALAVVVDGEDPETPVLVPDAALSPGRVTVRPYHRLGRVWRLEIIGHGLGHVVHVVRQLPQSPPDPLLGDPLLGELETATPENGGQ